jgi:hypothetical protein
MSRPAGGARDGTVALVWLGNGSQLRLDWFEERDNSRFFRLRTWSQRWDGWHLDPNACISSRELLRVLTKLLFAALRTRLRGILNPKWRTA